MIIIWGQWAKACNKCMCVVWLAIIMIFDDIILNVEAMHEVKMAMHVAILMKMAKFKVW